MFAHFGGLLFELLKFGRLSREEMARLIEVEGFERVVNAHKQGRGVFFVTGHFGYWEMQAIAHPLHRRRSPCWRVRSTTRCCTICSNGCGR